MAIATASFPWYATINDASLEQGDIFRSFPIFSPNVSMKALEHMLGGEKPEVPVETNLTDVIVVSQSCDLVQEKIDSVILCPVWSLSTYEEAFKGNSADKAKRKEEIRQGKEPSFHMLNKSEDHKIDYSLVEFRRIYTTPKEILVSFAKSSKDRVRLLPPYREHLSQAFARYFMRVGLPIDIPAFR